MSLTSEITKCKFCGMCLYCTLWYEDATKQRVRMALLLDVIGNSGEKRSGQIPSILVHSITLR